MFSPKIPGGGGRRFGFSSTHPFLRSRVQWRSHLFEDGGEAGKHIIDDVFGDGFQELPLSRR